MGLCCWIILGREAQRKENNETNRNKPQCWECPSELTPGETQFRLNPSREEVWTMTVMGTWLFFHPLLLHSHLGRCSYRAFSLVFLPQKPKYQKKKKKITFAKKINSYLEVLVGSWYLRERDFPGSLAGKESACNAGDPGSIPGSGRSPREGILELPWWLRQ